MIEAFRKLNRIGGTNYTRVKELEDGYNEIYIENNRRLNIISIWAVKDRRAILIAYVAHGDYGVRFKLFKDGCISYNGKFMTKRGFKYDVELLTSEFLKELYEVNPLICVEITEHLKEKQIVIE